MGQDNGKRKSIFIPFNQKLDDEISERISVIQSKKSSIKYKKFLKKQFIKNIEQSNFSHKFNEKDSGLNHITNLLNVIYSKNINNSLENLSGRTFYESIFQYDIIDKDNHDVNLINQYMINDMQNLINSEQNFEIDNQSNNNDSNNNDLNNAKNPFEVKPKSNRESNNIDNNSYGNHEISISNNQNVILNDNKKNKNKHLLEILKKKKTEIQSSLHFNENQNSEKKEDFKEKVNINKKNKLNIPNSSRLKNNNLKKTGPIINNNINSISPKKKIINSERVKTPIKKEKKTKSKSPIKNTDNKPLINLTLDISDIIKSSKYTNNYPKNKKDFERMDHKLNEEIQIITNPSTNINGKKYREVLNNENFLNVVDTLTQPNKQKKDLIQSFNYKPGINNISKGRKKNNNRDKTPKRYSDLIYKKYK